jgi:spore germination protein GerM
MVKQKIVIWLIIIVLVILTGCNINRQNNPANTPVINPNAEAANKDTSDVTLYFSYRGEDLLAGETRKISVPVSDKLEAAVVRELIKGPSADRGELAGLFWDNVKLVDVASNADILFVTLSNGFVSTSPSKASLEDGNVSEQKQLAIYSIVNTLVEMGNYSRVQILVDREGSKTGERITLGEAGWSGDTGTYLEPLSRDEQLKDLVLSPENTLKEVLASYGNKDWTRLYNFTAYNNPNGTVKPDTAAFSNALSAQGNILESYNVTSADVSYNGQTAMVMLDYSIKTRAGDTITKTDIPVIMVRDNDIWEMSYTSLVNVLINVG